LAGSLDSSQFDREFTSMPIFSPDQRDNKVRESVKLQGREGRAVAPIARPLPGRYNGVVLL